MNVVNVIDSPCGTGKTTYAIEYLNRTKEAKRFLYLTPRLDEFNRIMDSCSHFKQPKEILGLKSIGLTKLLQAGENVVSTHNLFIRAGEAVRHLIRKHKYVLVLDEVINAVENIAITPYDLRTLFETEKYLAENDDGRVFVTKRGKKYEGRLSGYIDYVKGGNVVKTKTGLLIWEFPIDVMHSFSEIWILTYMFEQQTMCNYLRANGFTINKFHVNRGDLIDRELPLSGTDYMDLINIHDNERHNGVGAAHSSLSVSWYMKAAPKDLDVIKNRSYNFCRNIHKGSRDEIMWTTFNEFKNRVSRGGMISSFVECTARATNQYRSRNVCSYLINRYENPLLASYFSDKGVVINQNVFALSELIQWLFRSAIRDGKPINLYIPSKRMRGLLKAWLDGTFEQKYLKGA